MAGPYRVGLRGTSKYQHEIAQSHVGEMVALVHDAANQHDDRAIVAFTKGRRFIGYLPRDSWLTGVILDQEIMVDADIESIADGGAGDLGVVLSVKW